jgi:hypothetical protein
VHQRHAHLGVAHPRLLGGRRDRRGDPFRLFAYPQLKPEDIRAAIAYGAEVARERVIPVPVTAGE